jgi:protein tyrosine/serine phosphatase
VTRDVIDLTEHTDVEKILHHVMSYVVHPTAIFPKFLSLLGNFYEVEPGKLYRSQQLSAQDLETCVKTYDIKTVINLRGSNPGKRWWIEEKRVLEKNNVTFFNISMNAEQLSTKENLLSLLTIYDTAELPMLVHCKAGADRIGEAVALWLLEKQRKTKEEALKALSIDYGHNTVGFPAKRFLIEVWKGREWLEKEYDLVRYTRLLMQR